MPNQIPAISLAGDSDAREQPTGTYKLSQRGGSKARANGKKRLSGMRRPQPIHTGGAEMSTWGTRNRTAADAAGRSAT